jgi:predicted amidohydrolase YtcJ
MDAHDTRGTAVAWRDGRLLAVGSRADVMRVAGGDAVSWSVAGATVLPGFVDAHHHPSLVALYGGLVRLTRPAVTNIASLQTALSRAAKGAPSDGWLVATEWDEMLLDERRPPTRQELDDAVSDRPVLALHYSCHRAVANSRALEVAGIGRDTPNPSGGEVSRGKGGLPDGLLIERGMSPAEALARASLVARDPEGFFERLAQHHDALCAAGITRVVDATVPGDLVTLYREAERRGVLKVPTVMMPVSTRGYLESPWDALDGPVTGEGSELLAMGPVKLVYDGAPGCAMCLSWWQMAGVMVGTWAMAVRQRSLDVVRTALSVAPRWGRQVRTGIHIYRQDEARQVVSAAADRGFALATHAIGNDAVSMALSVYEAVGAPAHRAGIPRLEHAMVLDRELVTRIAAVGAAVVTQPHMVTLPMLGSAPEIPGMQSMAHRWLLDAGVRLVGSSDHPVVGFEPLDGIRGAVLRRTRNGDIFEPEQRVELTEALAMYTRVAAEVCGYGEEAGTLAEGKRADLVVLDRPLSTSTLESARVRATVLGGELVFGAPAA